MSLPATHQPYRDLVAEARTLIADAGSDGMSSVAYDVVTRVTDALDRVRPEPVAAGETNLKPGLYRGGSDVAFGLFRLKKNGTWLFSSAVNGYAWRYSPNQTGEGLVLIEESDC